MPKNDKRMNGFENTHPEDLAAKEEKFRTFFSTSVAQVPDEMKRRDDDQKNPDTGKPGILSRILGRAKEEAAAEPAEEPKAQPQELPPTGEIRLGGEEEAAEPEADLELAADFFAPETPAQTPAVPEARPAPAPKAAAPAAPKPEKPAAPKLEKNYVRGPLTPQEQKEQSEMQELKALLFPDGRRRGRRAGRKGRSHGPGNPQSRAGGAYETLPLFRRGRRRERPCRPHP